MRRIPALKLPLSLFAMSDVTGGAFSLFIAYKHRDDPVTRTPRGPVFQGFAFMRVTTSRRRCGLKSIKYLNATETLSELFYAAN